MHIEESYENLKSTKVSKAMLLSFVVHFYALTRNSTYETETGTHVHSVHIRRPDRPKDLGPETLRV